MSLQSTASRRKLFHKFRGSSSGAGVEDFDDEAGAELPEVDVSFEYLKHTRDTGPYGGILSRRHLESAPIIPTLDSLDSRPSNNLEYRRQMNVQRKLALATGARANSLQSGPPGPMPDFRAMSLNSAPTGYGPRAMSLNGPRQNTMMLQPQSQQFPPGNPRAMSMRSYGTYNPAPGAIPGMPGPNGRTMSLNSNQGNVAGPRTMSLQGPGAVPAHGNNYSGQNHRMYNGNPQFIPNNQNDPRTMSLNSNMRFNGPPRGPPMQGQYNGQIMVPVYGANNGQFQQQQQQPQPPNMAAYKSQKASEESLMNVVEEEEEHQVQQENLSTDSFNPSVVSEEGRLKFTSRLHSASPTKPSSLDPGKSKSTDNSDDDDVVYKFDEEPPSISRKSTLKKTNSMKLRKLTLFQQEAEHNDSDVNTNDRKNLSQNSPPSSPKFNIRKSVSTVGDSPSKRISVLTDNESSKGALEQKFNVLGASAAMSSTASSNNVYYTASSFLPIRRQNLGLSIENTIEEEEIKTPQLSQYNDNQDNIETPKLAQRGDDTATLHEIEDDGDRATLHESTPSDANHEAHNNSTFASSMEDLNEEVTTFSNATAVQLQISPPIHIADQSVPSLKPVSSANTPDLNGTELTRFASNDSNRSGRRKPSFKSIVGNTVFSNFRSPSLNSSSPTFSKEEVVVSPTSKDVPTSGAPISTSREVETPTKLPRNNPNVVPTPTPGRGLPSPNIENLTSTIISPIDDEILYSPTRKPFANEINSRTPDTDSDEDMNSRIFNPPSGLENTDSPLVSPSQKETKSNSSGSNYTEEEEDGTATDDNGLSSVVATSGTSTTTANTIFPQYNTLPTMASNPPFAPHHTSEDSDKVPHSDSTLNPKVRRKPPPSYVNSPTRIHTTRPLSDLVDPSPIPLTSNPAQQQPLDRKMETESSLISKESTQRKLSIQSFEDGNKKRDSLGFAGKSKNFLRRWSKASRRLSEDFSLSASTFSKQNDDRSSHNRQSMPLIRNSVQSISTMGSTSGSRNTVPSAVAPPIQPTPIKFTKEELGIMNSTNELLNELQLVTTELASSIRRELTLEKELKGAHMGERVNTNSQPSMEDYTNRMKTISDLQEKLNKERRLRFISEDHALLWENGQQPSALKLGYEKAEIYQQLLAKNDLVNQLQDKVNELESKNKNNPDLLMKYNELLLENTHLKVQMKQQESNLIQTKQELYEALNNKENYMHTKNLSLINSFAASDADEVAEKIEEYKEEVAILKKQREELREAIGKLSHANDYEVKLANDKIKVLEEKVNRLKEMNSKLTNRMEARNSIEDGSNSFSMELPAKGGKLQGFSIVNPSQKLMPIRDRVN